MRFLLWRFVKSCRVCAEDEVLRRRKDGWKGQRERHKRSRLCWSGQRQRITYVLTFRPFNQIKSKKLYCIEHVSLSHLSAAYPPPRPSITTYAVRSSSNSLIIGRKATWRHRECGFAAVSDRYQNQTIKA